MENDNEKRGKILKIFDGLTETDRKSFLKILGIKDIDEINKIDLKKISTDFVNTRHKIMEIEEMALRKLKLKQPGDEPPDDVA